MFRKTLLLILTLIAVPLCGSAIDDYRRFRLALELREQADELDHSGRGTEALQRLEQARRTYPDFLDIYQEMAEIHIERKEWELAYAAVDEAVRRCPPLPASQAIVYRQRGFCLIRWGKLREAEADFRTALAYDPGESLSRRLLAQASTLGSQSSTLLPSGSISQAKRP